MNHEKSTTNIKKAIIIFACLIMFLTVAGLLIVPDQGEQATVHVTSERVLIPGGHSIGVKMDVKGVLIVGLEEIETITGELVNPGLMSGLQIGDTILTINETKVFRASEVQEIINRVKSDVVVKVQRKDQVLTIHLTPVIAKSDNFYKLGVWVKDKTAGIGTLTYYDPLDQTFGALGHAITDPETGSVLSVDNGELLNSSVQSLKQGKAGDPGEIKGIFYEEDAPLGKLNKNTMYGVFGTTYGKISNPLYEKPLVVASQAQIKKGPAYILTTLEGNLVEKYQVEIVKINRQDAKDTKSMVIRVTDERLLEKCGGIIQGMSGSPIIQNNRIIGAVTHVFVKNPEMGYGIFIEWMLQEGKA